jgi:SWI/SNF-related matrix-associated actin-dependent regulator 1 of chromatin subfamily A
MTVTIRGAGDRAEIAFPYDPAVVEAVREIPGRRWDPARKVWSAPLSSARHLAAFVTRTGATEDSALIAQIRAAAGDQDAAVVASRATDADIDLPEPQGLAYMPFQRAGIAFAIAHPNVLIADEMGLGKTIQAIGVVNADTSIRTVVCIVPASLKINWKREIEKWSTRQTSVVIGNGTVYEWNQMFANVANDVVQWLVVNYDVIDRWRDVIDAISLDALILDEVHYVKTPKAKRTIAVLGRWDRIEDKRVRPIKARRRLALTGTPILNRPVELWGIAHALAPQTFNSWRSYVYRYCDAQDTRFGFDVSGASNLDELQDRLRSTIMVRRLKADVLTELPAKRRAIVELPAGTAAPVIDAEAKAYELFQSRLAGLRAAVAAAEATEDREGYAEAVEALQKGQAIEFANISEQRHQVALAKVPAVIAHLTDQLESGKVICFAHHLDVVAAIHDAFPGSVVITGQTSMDKRQAAVDAFQGDPNCRLIIGNIRAMGVGLTLTASSHVVFAELDWTPANLSQAEDRAHRIGQRDSVLVQHLVLEGSLDASMARMLIAKQEVIDAALDTGTAPVIETAPITPVVRNVTSLDVSTLNGGYAVRNSEGNLTFLLFDSPTEGKWEGWTFVRQQIGGAAQKLGSQRPGKTYEGQWALLVAAVLTDPRTAMETYGKELGICGACMSPLTNAESRSLGIGPVCRARRGW